MELPAEQRDSLELLLSELEAMFPRSDAVIDVGSTPWRVSKSGAVHMGCRLVRLAARPEEQFVHFDDLLRFGWTAGFTCQVKPQCEIVKEDPIEPLTKRELFLAVGCTALFLGLVLIGILSVIGVT